MYVYSYKLVLKHKRKEKCHYQYYESQKWQPEVLTVKNAKSLCEISLNLIPDILNMTAIIE